MFSLVIPVFNEEQGLMPFYKEVMKVVKGRNYELLFIDDGSTDNSLNILKNLKELNKNIRIFSFRKNQGKAEALTLGFQKAEGDYIITLDADLQDDPWEIIKLEKKIEEGWDLISGWRKDRKDSISKVIASKFFNLISSFFWGLKVHDLNCGLKLYSKEAAKSLNLYGGMHRFIPLLLHDKGFRVTEVAVVHHKRRFGKSKYGISKVFKDLPDIFTMLFLSKCDKRPLHFFGTIGGLMLFVGILISIYLTTLRFQGESIGSRPLLLLGILLILAGLQVFFTGFLADLIIHLSEKDREVDSEDKKYSIKYSN